jgi:sugar lactone lactonase YvrE
MITSWPTVRTLAGQSATGSIDGVGAVASFDGPRGLTVDAAGNVYVADYFSSRIRKVTPTGSVITLAGWTHGFADGTGWTAGASGSAQFVTPTALAFHEASQKLYVADRGNSRIRLIDLTKSPSDATFVTTVAGNGTFGFYNGPGNIAMFNSPWGLASDGGGTLYVADTNNHMIRMIDSAGNVLTLAGQLASGSIDGTASAEGGPTGTAQFWEPRGVAVDDAGNVYVADYLNHKIRMISGGIGGVVSTVAGGGLSGSESGSAPSSLGTATGGPDGTARFMYPNALAWTPQGGASGSLYVSDSGNNRIVRIDLSQPLNGNVVEVALGVTRTPGFADGTSLSGMLYHPWGIAFGPMGKFYVADSENQRVRVGLDRGVGP